jgi:hypothetical protein
VAGLARLASPLGTALGFDWPPWCFSIAVHRLLCQWSQTELVVEDEVSERPCGKKLPSANLTFSSAGLDLRISSAGAMPF